MNEAAYAEWLQEKAASQRRHFQELRDGLWTWCSAFEAAQIILPTVAGLTGTAGATLTKIQPGKLSQSLLVVSVLSTSLTGLTSAADSLYRPRYLRHAWTHTQLRRIEDDIQCALVTKRTTIEQLDQIHSDFKTVLADANAKWQENYQPISAEEEEE